MPELRRANINQEVLITVETITRYRKSTTLCIKIAPNNIVKQIDRITKGDQKEENRINKSILGSLWRVETKTRIKLGKR